MNKEICALALALILFTGNSIPAASGDSSGQDKTLVLASPNDPFFLLAEEIARTENLAIVHHPEDALLQNPEFLLWVVSPANLSDRVFADFGPAVHARRTAISIGIISGSSIEHARALWRRAADAKATRVFAANAVYPTARVFEGRIHEVGTGEIQQLSKKALISALGQAGYLTFTGHGGAGYLSLAPQTKLTASDIPALPPMVMGTASCQTFRLWHENSIALAFADQGAAAYAGFVFSPNEGFLLGEFDGLPFRHSWPAFPIGHVMQVQTRGTLRGFAAFPYYYLLGDPRIALQKNPPYRLMEDRQHGENRRLSYADAPAGIIPVRIADGAPFRFVEIVRIAASGDDDPFYNSRLQTANIGSDKYLLFKHVGGAFVVRLRRDTPLSWKILNPLRDSFDGALIFFQQNAGKFFSLGIGILVWPFVGRRIWKCRVSRRSLPMAFLVGFGFSALQAAYAWIRLGQTTINEKPMAFSPLSLVGTFVLLAGAAFLYFSARSPRGHVLAILLGIFPLSAIAVFQAGVVFSINALASKQLGAGYYNYSLAKMSLIAAITEAILFAAVFELSRRICDQTRNPLMNKHRI